jgi:hypothetical protein
MWVQFRQKIDQLWVAQPIKYRRNLNSVISLHLTIFILFQINEKAFQWINRQAFRNDRFPHRIEAPIGERFYVKLQDSEIIWHFSKRRSIGIWSTIAGHRRLMQEVVFPNWCMNCRRRNVPTFIDFKRKRRLPSFHTRTLFNASWTGAMDCRHPCNSVRFCRSWAEHKLLTLIEPVCVCCGVSSGTKDISERVRRW